MCRYKAFSLIELLVVMAVVGLLAAIAVPAYTTYQIKSKIATNLAVVDAITKDAFSYYSRTGVFPPSIEVNGVTIPALSWTNVSYGSIKGIAYEYTSNGVMVNISTTGLDSIPNYITPTDASVNPSGGHSIMAYAVSDLGNGVTKTVCGHYDSDGYPDDDIPMSYLPSNCTCNTVGAFIYTGTGTC